MRLIVITNCTARKALSAPHRLRAHSLAKGSLKEVMKEWKRRLREPDDRVKAMNLYQGRAYCEASKAARLAGTPLCVISAGMGLITETDRIPPYSLTISGGHADSISNRIVSRTAFSPPEWWAALRTGGIGKRSLAEVVVKAKETHFVLAVSSTYLALVVEDLLELRKRDLDRVRLIGPRKTEEVHEDLQHIHMPYDSRLDGRKSSIRGTESDFPQRAARHFLELALRKRKKSTLERDRASVLRSLRGWPYKKAIVRSKLPETQLRRVVSKALREADWHWSVALRTLRDDLNVACEQGRFQKLCKDIMRNRR